MNFKPVSNYIVVELIIREGKTKGGIVIPETVGKRFLDKAIVRVVSEDVDLNGAKMIRNVKVGDSIAFPAYAGQMISIEEKEYALMRESEIFGIYSPEEPKSNLTVVN